MTEPILIPLMERLVACRSLAELAEASTRFVVEDLGATAAVLFDRKGPLSAHPVRVPGPLIIQLGELPPRTSNGAPTGFPDGLVATAQRIPNSDDIRIAAAWDAARAASADRLRTVVDILSGWIEEAGPDGIRRQRRLHGPGGRLLDTEDFTNLISSIPAIVYMAEMGSNGRWHYVSPQIESILGYTAKEWMDDPELWYRSIHPDDIEHALSFEDQRLIGLDIHPPAEYRLRTRDGRYIWIYERARLVEERDGEPLWHGVIQDVTARRVAEIELARKVEQQALLARLGEMAMRSEEPEELLETAIEGIRRLDRVTGVSIWEKRSGDTFSLSLVTRSDEPGGVTELPFTPTEFPALQMLRGEPILIPSWEESDPRLDPYREFIPDHVVSSFAAPIFGTDQQFGAILIHSDEPAAFTEEDCNFLLATAGLLGNAIQRSRADHSLRHRLYHDALTELPNRHHFELRLEEALATADRERRTVAVIFLDLDHFKLINDGIGHGAGDEVLRSMAPRLSASVRERDTVSRFGGDEFGILLSTVAGTAEAVEVAERALTAVSEPFLVEGSQRRITASAGISIRRPGEWTEGCAQEMIKEADTAMYSAKDAGRSQVNVFDDAIQDRVIHRLEIERGLHDAIERDEISVLFQPVIDLPNGRLNGFEALARWLHPTRGVLPPDEFIPVAEESELIREIDTLVLRKAVAAMADWNRNLPPDERIGVSVNFSARQLTYRNVIDLVAGLLSRHALAPKLLTVELTETTLLSGSHQVTAVLKELDRLGVRLSLDDFGTGFSSLGYLGEFPLDEIKIDRKFIEQLGAGDPRGSAIADAIVQIGTALSMTVVAEAVATELTLEMVGELGCHRAQGFLISPPLDLAAAIEMARRGGAVCSG